MDKSRFHIQPLDSLRGFAAMFVVCSHAINAVFNPHADLPVWNLLMSFSGLGMTLFFILSGFVIHYNYNSVRGLLSEDGITFFIARFARLYPLFIVMFIGELSYQCLLKDSCSGKHVISSMPVYLTFTQTWFYHITGGHSLTSSYWTVGGAGWSLSTEWFFYILYASFGAIMVNLLNARYIIRTALLVYFSEAVFMLWAWFHMSSISDWGTAHFGASSSSDSLYRWLVYFWPVARLGEFTLGAIAAQLFFLTQKYESTVQERYLADVFIWIVVLFIIAIHAFLHWEHNGLPGLAIAAPQLYSPFVAILVFACARYKDVSLTNILLWRPFLLIGEASYSIYLSHLFIISVIWAPLRDKLPHSLVYIGTIITVLVWSGISYKFLEKPMKEFVSRKLRNFFGYNRTSSDLGVIT